MTNAQPCRTLLIDDVPAQADAFGSANDPGPHQRVAEAIAELIESSEHGGKVIGLEGGWGAGKSTVVNLLRSRFKQNALHLVVAFDAWAHEGDPLRRTYLETLIRQLQDANWIDKETWNKHLATISNRRRETATRTVPKPTKLGTILALSVFGVPFGSTLVTAALKDGISLDWDLPPSWPFIFGSFLSLGPFVVLLFNLLRIGFRRLRRTPLVPDESEWAILLSHAITETRTETIESPNPTSIEFEDHFSELMRNALDGKSGRRLLLVLDNLDRVDPESALEIWSTLQTFLQDRQYRQELWFKRLWILVPFDPTGLRRLWDNRKSDHQQEQIASDSFLDKSFQVRFRVPPPVLSDWKAFLCRLVAESLPNHGNQDQHLIYRVFDQCRRHNGTPPTPRELKLFVNQIGAVHRQWQHTFPIGHVAYFVLCCRDGRPVIDRLRNNDIPDKDIGRILDGDVRASLAGLAFNVAADKGLELLLTEPIHQALTNSDDTSLKELAKRHGDGFWAVLETVASTKLTGLDGIVIASIAACLKRSELLNTNQRQEVATVLTCLRHASQVAEKWLPLDDGLAVGINALIEQVNDLNFTRTVLCGLATALTADSQQSDVQPENLTNAALSILETATNIGHSEAIPETLVLPLDAAGWSSACQCLIGRDGKGTFWNRLRPRVDGSDILSAVEADIVAGTFSQQHIHTLTITNSTSIRPPLRSVVAALRQRLDAASVISSKEAHCLIAGLCDFRKLGIQECVKPMKQLADGGHLLHHFHRATSEGNKDCQAICLFAFFRETPSGVKPSAVGNSDAGHTNLTTVLSSEDMALAVAMNGVLEKYGSLDLLFSVIDARSSYEPFLVQCLKEIASGPMSDSVLTPEVVYMRWLDIKTAFATGEGDGNFSSLVGRLGQNTNLCELIQDADGGFSITQVPLYSAILEGSESVAKFYEWCASGVEHLSADEWKSDLAGRFTCLQLVVELIDKQRQVSLSTPFADALLQHGASVAKGEHYPPDSLVQRWPEVIECFHETGTRKVLAERLLKAAMGMDGKPTPMYFDLYGTEISDVGTLTTQEEVVSQLLSPLVRERNVRGLHWAIDLFKAHPDFLQKVSTDHTVEEFEARLRNCVSDAIDDEAQPLIAEIAAICHIERLAVPEADGPQQGAPSES